MSIWPPPINVWPYPVTQAPLRRTPGPWRAGSPATTLNLSLVYTVIGVPLAAVFSGDHAGNAQIMAAGPALLDALVQARACLVTARAEINTELGREIIGRRIATASAAIALAEGRTP